MDIMLSVIIPAYNEEKSIEPTYNELTAILSRMDITYEIIFVDDGSNDKTAQIVQKLKNVHLIQHQINRGYGAALKTGIKKAQGEYILITDADGTYPPKEIPNLWQYAQSYDMVVGARIGEHVKIPLYRRPAKWLLHCLANYLSNTKIPDLNSGMRIFKKEDSKQYFNILCEGFSFTTTITLAYLARGLTIKYVPINYFQRIGQSKIKPIKDGMNFIKLIVNTTTYFNPLKIFIPVAALFFLAGGIAFLYSALFLGRILDSTTVILVVAAVQILLFGLLADLVVKRTD